MMNKFSALSAAALAALLAPASVMAGSGLFDGPGARADSVKLDTSAALTREALVEGSKKEGALLWYSALSEPSVKAILARFRETHDWVAADYVRVGGPLVIARFMAEKERRIENVDVISSGEGESFPELRKRGYLARVDNLPGRSSLCSWSLDPAGRYAFLQAFKLPIIYNSDLIKDEEAPRSLAELADPRWKGRLASLDPAASGAGLNFYRFAAQNKELGLPWMEKMRANEVLLVGQIGPLTETLASGVRPVGLGQWDMSEVVPAVKKGATLKMVFPKEGYLLQLYPSAVNAQAPHPHTARLFLDWMMSPATQAWLSKQGISHALSAPDCEKLRSEGGWVLDVEAIAPGQTKEFKTSASKALRGK